MKFIPSALVASLGCLALANVPIACVSNTAAPPGDVDSGGLPQEDSGLGGEDGGPPANRDAGPPANDASSSSDAAAEAAVDAGPQTLTLTVLLLGAPEPGVPIVFQDATGAVITTVTTGSAGTVEQLVTAGSQVTAVMGTAQRPNLVTIQGVAPGDNLTVVDTPSSNPPPVNGDFSVSVPAPVWDASGITEQVYAGNCYQGLPSTLYVAASCASAGEFPLFARAVDTTGAEIAYTYQGGNALAPDGGLPDGDTAFPISVSRPWSTPSASLTLTATNPPSLPTADGGAIGTSNDVQLSYNEVTGGVSMASPSSTGDVIDDAGTQTIDYVMHPGFPDFVQAVAIDQINTAAGTLIVGAATRMASPSASQSVSLDMSTLAPITATALDSTDGGTTSQPNVTWTSTGSLSAANGLFVSAQWFAALDGSSQSGTWTILAPSTVTNVRAPALPAAQAAWAPPSNAEFDVRPRMGAIQASFLTGYAGLRAVFGNLPFMSGYQIVVPTLPVNGTIYIVGLYENEG